MELRWPGVHKDFIVNWTNTYEKLRTLKYEIEALQYWTYLSKLEKIRKGLLKGKDISYNITRLDELNNELNKISRQLYEKSPEYSYRPLFC